MMGMNVKFLLVLILLALNPVSAVDLDDFVPADGDVVTTTLIANGAVTSDKIANSAITSEKLGTAVVQSANIADNSITTEKILNETITSADFADNTIDGAKIANGAITGIDLASDTITATQIATDAVGSSEIAADAVGASEIAAGAVGHSELAADSVITNKILDGTISAADIAAGVISTVGTKYTQLEIGAGIRTSLTIGTVGSGYGAAPVLRYDNTNASYSRWTFPIPDDYISGTDIAVELLWTPSNTNAGDVVWQLDYAALAAGELVPDSAAFSSKIYTQASPGATLALTSTANNLTISAADIAADDMISLVLLRDPDAVADTYNSDVNIHLVKLKYQAKKVN